MCISQLLIHIYILYIHIYIFYNILFVRNERQSMFEVWSSVVKYVSSIMQSVIVVSWNLKLVIFLLYAADILPRPSRDRDSAEIFILPGQGGVWLPTLRGWALRSRTMQTPSPMESGMSTAHFSCHVGEVGPLVLPVCY